MASHGANVNTKSVADLIKERNQARRDRDAAYEQLEHARGWLDIRDGELASANEQRDAAVARAEAAEQAVQQVRAETAEAIAQAIDENAARVLGTYADGLYRAARIARQHAKGDGDE